MKTVIRIVLVLFVLASGFYLAVDRSENTAAKPDIAVTETASPEMPGDQVLVYYFHGDVRCPTCMKIEALSTEAVEKGFDKELKNGRVAWQVVNIETPENAHFVDDFELYTKSLILVKKNDGVQTAWKNLPRIWELVNDDTAFIDYVDGEVKAYLGGA